MAITGLKTRRAVGRRVSGATGRARATREEGRVEASLMITGLALHVLGSLALLIGRAFG